VIFSHLGEEEFVVGFEPTLECLLEPEREHDQPRIIRVATRVDGKELEGANIGDVSKNVQWEKLHAELAGRICTMTGKCQKQREVGRHIDRNRAPERSESRSNRSAHSWR
jgi:hypothetical protein